MRNVFQNSFFSPSNRSRILKAQKGPKILSPIATKQAKLHKHQPVRDENNNLDIVVGSGSAARFEHTIESLYASGPVRSSAPIGSPISPQNNHMTIGAYDIND